MAKVLEIDNNLAKLKVGMSAKKVRFTLGLTNYNHVVIGSGPMSDYRSYFQLSSGYGLVIAFDMTKKPVSLNWAELRKDGKTIRSIEK